MKKYGYIEDGYTRKGFISGKEKNGDERPYPELRFEYRPMLYSERRKIMKKFDQPNQPDIVAGAIAEKLESWDLIKPVREDRKIVGEEVVEIRKEEILRVHPELMDTLFYIIAGTFASDPDPEWTDEETTENEEDQVAAATTGTDPGVNREGKDSKNSAPG